MSISVGGLKINDYNNIPGMKTYNTTLHNVTLGNINNPQQQQQITNTYSYADKNINSIDRSEYLLQEITKFGENQFHDNENDFNNSKTLYNSFINCVKENINSNDNDKISDFDKTLEKIYDNLSKYNFIKNDINKIIIETIKKRLIVVQNFKDYIIITKKCDNSELSNLLNRVLNKHLDIETINKDTIIPLETKNNNNNELTDENKDELVITEELTRPYKNQYNKDSISKFIRQKNYSTCSIYIFYILKTFSNYFENKINKLDNLKPTSISVLTNNYLEKNEYKDDESSLNVLLILYEYCLSLKSYFSRKTFDDASDNVEFNKIYDDIKNKLEEQQPIQGGKRKTQKKKPKSKTQKKLKNKNKKSKKNKR